MQWRCSSWDIYMLNVNTHLLLVEILQGFLGRAIISWGFIAVMVCSQRSTRACWDDHFEHIPWHIAEADKLPSANHAGCQFSVCHCLQASILLNHSINPSIQFDYYHCYHISTVCIYHISKSTNKCHVYYICHLVSLHQNCCEKRMIC